MMWTDVHSFNPFMRYACVINDVMQLGPAVRAIKMSSIRPKGIPYRLRSCVSLVVNKMIVMLQDVQCICAVEAAERFVLRS